MCPVSVRGPALGGPVFTVFAIPCTYRALRRTRRLSGWLFDVQCGALLEASIGVPRETADVPRLYRVVGRPGPAAEPRALVVLQCLLNARLIVHHERSVLGDRFTNGSALQQEHLGARGAGRDGDRFVGADDDAR